jgi:hypothetical protein
MINNKIDIINHLRVITNYKIEEIDYGIKCTSLVYGLESEPEEVEPNLAWIIKELNIIIDIYDTPKNRTLELESISNREEIKVIVISPDGWKERKDIVDQEFLDMIKYVEIRRPITRLYIVGLGVGI